MLANQLASDIASQPARQSANKPASQLASELGSQPDRQPGSQPLRENMNLLINICLNCPLAETQLYPWQRDQCYFPGKSFHPRKVEKFKKKMTDLQNQNKAAPYVLKAMQQLYIYSVNPSFF